MLRPATDLANNKASLLTERPSEKPTFHSTKVVTHVSNLATHWLGWSSASEASYLHAKASWMSLPDPEMCALDFP